MVIVTTAITIISVCNCIRITIVAIVAEACALRFLGPSQDPQFFVFTTAAHAPSGNNEDYAMARAKPVL